MDIKWVELIISAVLAGATVVLAYATYRYAKQTKETEEKGRINKAMGIRKLILGELALNDDILLENILYNITMIIKEEVKDMRSIEAPIKDVYNHIVGEMGILGDEEILTIMHVYTRLDEIKKEYTKIEKAHSGGLPPGKLKFEAGELRRNIDDLKKFRKAMNDIYDKRVREEIDDDELERQLEDVYEI